MPERDLSCRIFPVHLRKGDSIINEYNTNIYVCLHTYIYTYTHIYIHTYIYNIYMYIYVYTHTYIHI